MSYFPAKKIMQNKDKIIYIIGGVFVIAIIVFAGIKGSGVSFKGQFPNIPGGETSLLEEQCRQLGQLGQQQFIGSEEEKLALEERCRDLSRQRETAAGTVDQQNIEEQGGNAPIQLAGTVQNVIFGDGFLNTQLKRDESGRLYINNSLPASPDIRKFYSVDGEEIRDPKSFFGVKDDATNNSETIRINPDIQVSPERFSDRVITQCDLPKKTDYLIVSRPLFETTIKPFIERKKIEGHVVTYINLEELLDCELEGRDIPEKIRNYLKNNTNTTKLKYVLFVGNPRPIMKNFTPLISKPEETLTKTLVHGWEMPIRYVYNPDEGWALPYKMLATDHYYSTLSGSWDDDNDDIFGEYLEKEKKYEFSIDPQLYIGRVPVISAEDLKNWIEKTLNWKPPKSPKQSLFISAFCLLKPEVLFDETGKYSMPYDVYIYFTQYAHKISFNFCQTDKGGDEAEIANLQDADFVSTYSHGFIKGTAKLDKEKGYSISTKSPDFKKNPILFVHGCLVGSLDLMDLFGKEDNYQGFSLAQKQIASSGGSVAVIASSRSHWDIPFDLWTTVFALKKYQLGPAFYATEQYMMKKRGSVREMQNFLMYHLYGDPALKVIDRPSFELTSENFTLSDGGKVVTFTVKNNKPSSIKGAIRVLPRYGEHISLVDVEMDAKTNTKLSYDLTKNHPNLSKDLSFKYYVNFFGYYEIFYKFIKQITKDGGKKEHISSIKEAPLSLAEIPPLSIAVGLAYDRLAFKCKKLRSSDTAYDVLLEPLVKVDWDSEAAIKSKSYILKIIHTPIHSESKKSSLKPDIFESTIKLTDFPLIKTFKVSKKDGLIIGTDLSVWSPLTHIQIIDHDSLLPVASCAFYDME